MIYLLLFLLEALWCRSFHSSSRIEDHVLFVLIHLTEVLCHLFKFFSSYQVLHLFSTGVLSVFVRPCSSILTELVNFVHLCCILSFKLFNLSRFFGFTHLSKKQLSFTSSLPLPFLSGAILDLGTRSLVSEGVLWRPETDAPNAFHVLRVSCFIYLFVWIHQVIICIASAFIVVIVFKTCIRS